VSDTDESLAWTRLSWFQEAWEGAESALRPEDLDELEQLAGCPLPQAFRAFYLRHNGGWPVAASGMLHGFVAAKHGALPIERLWADLRDTSGSFDEWMPFAHDPGGNLYLLHVGSRSTATVRVYLSGEDRCVPCADSFEQLLRTVRRDD
jgi:cell wall assembly regulator SMI1